MKTPEEKAREYAGKADESRRGFQDYIIVETKYKSFLNGFHSRDEEVQAYREALKEMISTYDRLGIADYRAIKKAKQLLKEEEI